jgi:predicted alpha/beta-fold hydrolase
LKFTSYFTSELSIQNSELQNYSPKPGLSNGHVMTVYAWGRPRHFPRLPAPSERFFDTAPDARVLAHCHWQPDRRRHPAILALHGLDGSSTAHYMRGLADKAYAAGFSVVLLNQRNCGGTEQLSAGLYHSGLTADPDHVVRELAAKDGIERIVVAGYSLGGNLALKLAGDYGDTPPPELLGVCAVSPVIELEACVRSLERRQNMFYQWNFVRGLKARMRRKAQFFPGRFAIERLNGIHTVREFDEAFTAPHFGFHGASDYYHRASAMRVIDRVRVPSLVITAEDDPFVPSEPFRDRKVAGNPRLRVIITRHGGHCGFIAGPSDEHDDGYWAEQQILAFAASLTGATAAPSAASQTRVPAPALRA